MLWFVILIAWCIQFSNKCRGICTCFLPFTLSLRRPRVFSNHDLPNNRVNFTSHFIEGQKCIIAVNFGNHDATKSKMYEPCLYKIFHLVSNSSFERFQYSNLAVGHGRSPTIDKYNVTSLPAKIAD